MENPWFSQEIIFNVCFYRPMSVTTYIYICMYIYIYIYLDPSFVPIKTTILVFLQFPWEYLEGLLGGAPVISGYITHSYR